MRVTQAERDIVERTLWFANLKRITSTRQVELHFARARVLPPNGAFRGLRPDELAAYRRDQVELRRHLSAIADDQRREVANVVLPIVNRQLAEIVGVQLGIQGSHVVLRYDLAGVAALCALGLMFLLDEDRGLGRRLGRCGAPGCERFNLAFAGRPRRHCVGHLDAARNVDVADRVRRKRARDKAARVAAAQHAGRP
jgi:hypothetical protein